MSYYERITTRDSNPLKRRFQSSRLRHGCRPLNALPRDYAGKMLDVGAASGSFTRRLAEQFPLAQIVCYEPVPTLRSEAEHLLRDCARVELIGDLATLGSRRFDYVFCLEVFEHLPTRHARRLIRTLGQLLDGQGQLVIGVPNELHVAALAKGLFRFSRRRGSFDATWTGILSAIWGRPPVRRPRSQIWPGWPYYYHHLGFDYRRLRRVLGETLNVRQEYGSPAPWLPSWLNSEVYFVCRAGERLERLSSTSRARSAA